MFDLGNIVQLMYQMHFTRQIQSCVYQMKGVWMSFIQFYSSRRLYKKSIKWSKCRRIYVEKSFQHHQWWQWWHQLEQLNHKNTVSTCACHAYQRFIFFFTLLFTNKLFKTVFTLDCNRYKKLKFHRLETFNRK